MAPVEVLHEAVDEAGGDDMPVMIEVLRSVVDVAVAAADERVTYDDRLAPLSHGVSMWFVAFDKLCDGDPEATGYLVFPILSAIKDAAALFEEETKESHLVMSDKGHVKVWGQTLNVLVSWANVRLLATGCAPLDVEVAYHEDGLGLDVVFGGRARVKMRAE